MGAVYSYPSPLPLELHFEFSTVDTVRGFLPFRFGGKPFPSPFGVGGGIMPSNAYYWLIRLVISVIVPVTWRFVPGCSHKLLILRVGHFVLVDAKRIKINFMLWVFIVIAFTFWTTHEKLASGNENHLRAVFYQFRLDICKNLPCLNLTLGKIVADI